jgi:hypothetical protein
MIVVAMVAVLLACLQRRAQFLQLAQQHSDAGAYYPGLYVDPMDPWYEHHRSLAAKYRRAARCPWLPVSPDPPEPKRRELELLGSVWPDEVVP